MVSAEVRSVPVDAAPARRSSLTMALAAFFCGLGLAAIGVTLVRAADDAGIFWVLRSDYLDRMAASLRLRERPDVTVGPLRSEHTAGRARKSPALTIAQRKAAARRVRAAAAGAASRSAVDTRRTMCVRVCDGYTFPVGTLRGRADLPVHETACQASCPGAETRLYTLLPGQRLEDPANARAVSDGTAYARLKTAFLFRTQHVAACSCQNPDNVASRLPLMLDPTLRPGDVVIDPAGEAKAFAGTGRIPHSPRSFADYRRSPVMGRTARAQVDRLVGTSQREATARAFERSLRTREAGLGPTREIAAPAGSGSRVRAYQVTSNAGSLDASGARIILVR